MSANSTPPEGTPEGGHGGGQKGDHSQATARPHLSMAEATEATGRPRTTLRRMRERGEFPNSYQRERDKAWMIPVDDLLSAGLSLAKSATSETPPARGVAKRMARGVAKVATSEAPDEADLRAEIERERGLRLAAESEMKATAREVEALRDHLATAKSALKMIEAAPPKIETRVERVEVPKIETHVERVEVPVEVPTPVMPSWAWWVITALLLALAALVAAWTLTPRNDSAAAPTQPPANPVPTVAPASPPSPDLSTPVPVVIDPPPKG